MNVSSSIFNETFKDDEKCITVSWSMALNELKSCFGGGFSDINSLVKACLGDKESENCFQVLLLNELSNKLKDLGN